MSFSSQKQSKPGGGGGLQIVGTNRPQGQQGQQVGSGEDSGTQERAAQGASSVAAVAGPVPPAEPVRGRQVRSCGDEFYRTAMHLLRGAGVEFLVGGAYALRAYSDITRDTKDFDIFVREADVAGIVDLFRGAGYRSGLPFPHWLGKIHLGENFIDLVFRAGNGLCAVDERWFASAPVAELLGVEVRLVPPEFIIWQKAYVMERERYDGADVAHILRSCAGRMDWALLVELFGPDWRVLFNQLILFGFIYPGERDLVPDAVMRELLERLRVEIDSEPSRERICRGTLISREQFLPDVDRWGYADARLDGRCCIDEAQIRHWTEAIGRPDP